jgi:DNA invertase Pin-like site-specific DNA recombinase
MLMKRVAIYARSSPDCPLRTHEQISQLSKVAAEHRWTVTHVFTDCPTSVKKNQDRRPGELALIGAIRSGVIDAVLIWSIDRVGKSLIDLVGFMETCRSACVAVNLHDEGLDSETSNGLSLFDVSALLAHHLRQSRRDRILRGQAAARALSIRFGRPPIAKPKVEKAKQFLASGKGVRQVAKMAGISAASVSRIKTSMTGDVTRL